MWLVILRHASELNIEIDQNADVFMNMLQYHPGDLGREPCSDDWFSPAHTRAPPTNMLTNRTPALLHFNGPSHEDDVWTSCYHVFNDRFRAVGKQHTSYDVDHDMHISTDMLCDYSWYRIRN